MTKTQLKIEQLVLRGSLKYKVCTLCVYIGVMKGILSHYYAHTHIIMHTCISRTSLLKACIEIVKKKNANRLILALKRVGKRNKEKRGKNLAVRVAFFQ